MFFAGLEQMGGVEAEVERVDHSQIEKLRREVKEDAIKVAKEKATGLAAAIGQSIKKAIYIRKSIGEGWLPNICRTWLLMPVGEVPMPDLRDQVTGTVLVGLSYGINRAF